MQTNLRAFTLTCSAVSALCCLSLPSQEQLRQWGLTCYDTASRAVACAKVATNGGNAGFLRADGRLFVHGNEGLGGCDVPALPPGLTFVDIAFGMDWAVGLLSDGTAVKWGNVATYNIPPIPALPPGVRYVGARCGRYHCILERSDHVFVLLGMNNLGQLNVPLLPPRVTIVAVDTKADFSLALLSNGDVIAWGDNAHGQCNVPALPPGVVYTSVRAGWEHALAQRSDGVVVAWGSNTYGECNMPTLPPNTAYVKVSAGWRFSAAWRSDGVFVAWPPGFVETSAPSGPTASPCLQLECGAAVTMALLASGEIVTWGRAEYYADVPLGGTTPADRFGAFSNGLHHTLVLHADGTAAGFGWNGYHQCDVPILPTGLRYTAVAAGASHSAALRTDGALLCWGGNSVGQCTVPMLPQGVTYTDVAVSWSHTIALRSDGSAVTFGDSFQPMNAIPAALPGNPYVKVDAGYHQNILLRADGSVVSLGEVGTNGVAPPLPAHVRYVDIAAGDDFQMALRSDGQAVVWPASQSPPPPSLPWGLYYVEIDNGQGKAVLRRSDGQAFMCGSALQIYDVVPPLEPGLTYNAVAINFDSAAGLVGAATTYVGVGHGCAGSMPAARLVPRDTPRIGKPLQVTITDAPQNAAFMLFGWQRLAPVSLAALGMPGCLQHVSLDGAFFLSGEDTRVQFQFSIPSASELVGVRFYNQALVLDTGVNTLGAVVSDAAEAVIGR